MNNEKLKKNKKRGITLFIAVSVTGILLFIAFAVTNIALKGTLFASSGRDSQFAFYAADAGMECALYWDSRFEPSKFDITLGGSPITCSGTSASPYSMTTGQPILGTTTTTRIGGGGVGTRTSTFGFTLNYGVNAVPHCAIVTVTKNADGTTYIKSRGYNTCDINNTRRVERGIEVTY